MANPQKENGYTPIAHTILEALATHVISPDEWRVLMVIFRKTYGWDKKEDSISHTQFYDMTGISRNHIPRVIKKLMSRNIICKVSPEQGTGVSRLGNTIGIRYGFQKDFDKWTRIVSPKQGSPKQDKGVPQTGLKVSPKQGHTKDIKLSYKRKASSLSDEEWLQKIKALYPILDVEQEINNCKAHFLPIEPSRQRILNWLKIAVSRNSPFKGKIKQPDDAYSHLEVIHGTRAKD